MVDGLPGDNFYNAGENVEGRHRAIACFGPGLEVQGDLRQFWNIGGKRVVWADGEVFSNIL